MINYQSVCRVSIHIYIYIIICIQILYTHMFETESSGDSGTHAWAGGRNTHWYILWQVSSQWFIYIVLFDHIWSLWRRTAARDRVIEYQKRAKVACHHFTTPFNGSSLLGQCLHPWAISCRADCTSMDTTVVHVQDLIVFGFQRWGLTMFYPDRRVGWKKHEKNMALTWL